MVYRALVRLLGSSPDLEVVATAPDGPTALALAAQLRPRVVLVDAGTRRLDGMEITRSLRKHEPAVRVVVMSVYATFRDQALAAGGCRFLLKDSGREQLLTAIRLAAVGECQVSTSSPAEAVELGT